MIINYMSKHKNEDMVCSHFCQQPRLQLAQPPEEYSLLIEILDSYGATFFYNIIFLFLRCQHLGERVSMTRFGLERNQSSEYACMQ